MPVDQEENYFLEALKKEEERLEEERILEQSEFMREKRSARPDWWTQKDLMMDLLSPKPEGFLASDEVFCRETVNMAFGPGGAMKTWLTMHLMDCITTGKTFAGIPTRKGRCLFVSEELSRKRMKKRVLTLLTPEEIEIRGDTVAYRFHDPDNPLDFHDQRDLSKRRLCTYIAESNEPDIVIIDSLVKTHTGDEKNNSHGTRIMNAYADVALKMNVCIVLIHHTGKENEFRQGSEKARGWSCIRDICADMLLIEPVKNQKGKSAATWTKTADLSAPISNFNFTLERNPKLLSMSAFSFGFDDSQTSSTVKLADMSAMVDVVYDLAGSDGEVLRDALRSAVVGGRGWGRNRFELCLSECVRNGKVGRKSRGKEAAYFIPRGERNEQEEPNEPQDSD